MKENFFEKNVKIIVVLAVIAGSTSGIFGSVIQAPSMTIGFWRLAIGLPFFAVPVLTKQRAELKNISKKDYIWTFIAGAFLFGHFFTWFNAVKMTNIASAVVLAALHPLIVLLITIFVFRKKIGRRPIMGIVLALLGGSLIAGLDYNQLTQGHFVGDVLAFLAALFMGIYFAIGNNVRQRVPAGPYVFLVFASCFTCFAIGIVATQTPIIGYDMKDYLYILAMTLVCQIGAHAVFNWCMGYVDSLYVSTWESGESVFAIIMGIIFLRQRPESWEIIGAMVVVIGLLYYNYSINEANKDKGESI